MVNKSISVLFHTIRKAGIGYFLMLFAMPAVQATEANPFSDDPQAEIEGGNIFGQYCQACHNTRGHGGKCPQLVRGAWGPAGANSDTYMFEIIAHGRPNTQMGAFSGALSEDQIWKVVSFLRAEAVRIKEADATKKKNPEEDLWY